MDHPVNAYGFSAWDALTPDDLIIFGGSGAGGGGADGQVQLVPEPSSITLWGLATFILMISGQRPWPNRGARFTGLWLRPGLIAAQNFRCRKDSERCA